MKEVQVVGRIDGKLVFALKGDIDSGNADNFYDIVNNAYIETPADVIFECDELNFIDSTTLGTFVKILKKVKTDGHKMTLRKLHPNVKKLFLICALNTIMEIE